MLTAMSADAADDDPLEPWAHPLSGMMLPAAERWLDRPLASLASRAPVTCPPETPLGAALETLRRERIGSIIVVDAELRPLGVFTLHDVLERVAIPGAKLATPIADVMSREIWTLPPDAPAFEAALLMARENIRHAPHATWTQSRRRRRARASCRNACSTRASRRRRSRAS